MYHKKIVLRNFTLKNCMLGATDIVKNSDKEKYVYSGYIIASEGKGSWGVDNDFARNVVIFGVDDSSSFHTDNQKKDFLILGEGDTFGINRSFGPTEKKFSINFSKTKTKFCLHCNGNNTYLFVNGKEIHKFKASKKSINFTTQFCLGRISSKC